MDMEETRAYARSVASLRLSEQIAALSDDKSVTPCDTVEMKTPGKVDRDFDLDTAVNAQGTKDIITIKVFDSHEGVL